MGASQTAPGPTTAGMGGEELCQPFHTEAGGGLPTPRRKVFMGWVLGLGGGRWPVTHLAPVATQAS